MQWDNVQLLQIKRKALYGNLWTEYASQKNPKHLRIVMHQQAGKKQSAPITAHAHANLANNQHPHITGCGAHNDNYSKACTQ